MTETNSTDLLALRHLETEIIQDMVSQVLPTNLLEIVSTMSSGQGRNRRLILSAKINDTVVNVEAYMPGNRDMQTGSLHGMRSSGYSSALVSRYIEGVKAKLVSEFATKVEERLNSAHWGFDPEHGIFLNDPDETHEPETPPPS